MDTVTYPHGTVREELSHWVVRKIDITERRDAAAFFQVAAVPVAVALTPAGEELGRLANFVEPESFRGQLGKLRDSTGAAPGNRR